MEPLDLFDFCLLAFIGTGVWIVLLAVEYFNNRADRAHFL